MEACKNLLLRPLGQPRVGETRDHAGINSWAAHTVSHSRNHGALLASHAFKRRKCWPLPWK